ncbi:MAG TPA: pyridoxamine 5'-phosphate oxidase family protein [Acidimicrobiales bacterium]|nr:pyridoxamine 5'-phosphate oxidase family protein [Acidimicrobiales bacterium]
MVSWATLRALQPELAHAGSALLYQHGVGLAFMATTRNDGGPRVHPVCPLLNDRGMFAFVIPSPKQDDLHRDGRCALHSFPTAENEDAFYVRGRARPVEDDDLRRELGRQFVDERAGQRVPAPGLADHLFEFEVEACQLTRTRCHGDPDPVHQIWRAPPD